MNRWRCHLAVWIGLPLVIALLALAAPLWLPLLRSPAVPDLAAAVSGPCLAPADWMRTRHMHLLAEWRDMAVRSGIRTYTGPDGRTWTISLRQTCLECHHDQAAFCDACHISFGVTPACWTCHTTEQP